MQLGKQEIKRLRGLTYVENYFLEEDGNNFNFFDWPLSALLRWSLVYPDVASLRFEKNYRMSLEILDFGRGRKMSYEKASK